MIANMMPELRKYGVGPTLAHQHLHQLKPEMRHAAIGSADTMIAFPMGAEETSYVAEEF